MILKTERLSIHPFDVKDQATMIRLLTDRKIKDTYMIPDFDCEEKVIRLFLRFMDLSNDDSRVAAGIYLDEQLIGFLNDTGIEGTSIELGYVIDPAFHNQGYMTEALKAVINHLLQQGFEQIITGAFVRNPASVRVMGKCGMVKMDKVDSIEYRGKTEPCVYYMIRK